MIAADGGGPVWPLRQANDLEVLQDVARMAGREVRRVVAIPGTSEPLSPELVVGLGACSGEPARLHAHLTRRHCVILNSWEELVRLAACPAVLVTTPENLTVELLEWLYDDRRKTAPGIVCGAGVQDLLRQVLVRSAAACLSGPSIRDRIEIYPTIPVEGIAGIVGAGSSRSERREALAGDAGVLTVMTHCDGVDAFFGSDLSICARNHDSADLGPARAPRCGLTGYCHRHETMVADAVSSSAVVPVEGIAARVLVWDVCFGIMPAHSVVDPAWGIGVRLMQSHTIGAVLTTWQITLSSAACAHLVTDMIASGMPAGKVVARFNASRQAREHNYRMCLLGDPRLALPRPGGGGGGAGSATQRARKPRRPAWVRSDLKELALLRLCMIDAKSNAAEGQRAALAQRALEAIGTLEATASRRTSDAESQDVPAREMRERVLDYALARGKLLENWMPFARNFRAAAPTSCLVCGKHTNVLQATLRLRGPQKRRLTLCPICGVLEDAPTTSTFAFTLDGPMVHLRGDLPRRNWSAAVLLGSPHPADSLRLAWPELEDGRPATTLELPAKWPPGPLRLSVFLFWDTTFAVASRMVREPVPSEASGNGTRFARRTGRASLLPL